MKLYNLSDTYALYASELYIIQQILFVNIRLDIVNILSVTMFEP